MFKKVKFCEAIGDISVAEDHQKEGVLFMAFKAIAFRKGTNGGETARNTVLRMRGIGGRLLPIGGGKLAMMRDGDDLLSISERRKIVFSRANQATFPHPGPELGIFGQRCIFRHGGKTFEAVLGLANSPESVRALDKSIGSGRYSVNQYGMIVNVPFLYLKGIVDALNSELGLKPRDNAKLKLLDLSTAGALVRNEAAFLCAREISGFWTSEIHPKTEMPMLQFTSHAQVSKDYDPATSNEYTGIVLGREIDLRIA